jgi:o-succinylbenzoate---CoA ligase
VRRGVADRLGRATPRAVRVLDELPLRGIGKPDRAAVRDLFAGHDVVADGATRPS